MTQHVIFMRHDKKCDFFENLSKKKRARTATAATAAEECSQSIQVPSSTHPGTTYPVRAIPHSDLTTPIGDRSEGFVKRFWSIIGPE